MHNFTFFSRLKKSKSNAYPLIVYPQLEVDKVSAYSQPDGVYRAESYDEASVVDNGKPSFVYSPAPHQLAGSPTQDVWQVKTPSAFPTELPVRPQKTSRLRLRKRLTLGNAPLETPLDTFLTVSSPESSPRIVASGFPAVAGRATNHMSTRQTTSAPRDETGAIEGKMVGIVSSHPFSSTIHSKDTIIRQEPSDVKIPFEIPRSVSQQTQPIKRKPVPSPKNSANQDQDQLVERFLKLNAKDPLPERFARLRPQIGKVEALQTAPATTCLSRSSITVPPPSLSIETHDHSSGVENEFLDNMTKSNLILLPSKQVRLSGRTHHSKSAHRRRKSIEPTENEKEEDDETLPMSVRSTHRPRRRHKSTRHTKTKEDDNDLPPSAKRSTTNFSDVNYFQGKENPPAQPRIHTHPRRRRTRVVSLTQSNTHRSRNASSNSDGALTPESSDDASCLGVIDGGERVKERVRGPSLSSRNPFRAAKEKSPSVQEERDRRFVSRVQREKDEDEEDEGFDQGQFSFFEQLEAVAQELFAPRLAAKRKTASRGSQNESRSSAHRGTHENPIDLDSDFYSDLEVGNVSDEDSVANSSRPQHDLVLDEYCGEPMDLDPLDPSIDDFPNDDHSFFRKRAESELRDAEMARALQEEEEEQSRKMPRNTRECAVCSDDIAIAELPSLANCAHQPQTCAECYGVWITTQLRDNSWREVKCPANECKIILAYYEIQQYAAQEIFEQYDTFTARAVFSDDPNFRWCRAEGCKSGQFHDGGQDGNIFTCAACKLKVCIVHEDTWHEGETCEEYEYRRSGKKEQDQRAQEEASLQEISKSTKKCPGAGCVYNIEKNDGCDHMTCSKCRYEFCWICLCDYNEVRSKGNAAHTDDCKYHTTRLH